MPVSLSRPRSGDDFERAATMKKAVETATRRDAQERPPARERAPRERAEARWRAIRAVAGDELRCPVCDRGPLVKPRQWVRKDGYAVCKACHMRGRQRELLCGRCGEMPGKHPVTVKGVGECVSWIAPTKQHRLQLKVGACPTHWGLDPAALIVARQCANISSAEFARRAGWTRSRQSRLESGEIGQITAEALSVMLQVLREAGVSTVDER